MRRELNNAATSIIIIIVLIDIEDFNLYLPTNQTLLYCEKKNQRSDYTGV